MERKNYKIAKGTMRKAKEIEIIKIVKKGRKKIIDERENI